jgi:hypothetical protein
MEYKDVDGTGNPLIFVCDRYLEGVTIVLSNDAIGP